MPVFTASFSGQTMSTAMDLFELVADSDYMIELLSCRVGQISEFGDAEAELLTIQIGRATGSGSGGQATLVPAPHNVGDATFSTYGGSCEGYNTTLATGFTAIISDVWNVQAGWLYVPIPEERIWVPPSGRIVVRSPDTPDDEITSGMAGSLTFAIHA